MRLVNTQEHIGRTNSNRPTGPYEAVCDRDQTGGGKGGELEKTQVECGKEGQGKQIKEESIKKSGKEGIVR